MTTASAVAIMIFMGQQFLASLKRKKKRRGRKENRAALGFGRGTSLRSPHWLQRQLSKGYLKR